jgi:hypothetical protein
MAGPLWTSDFVLSQGRIKVRKTGADLALDGALAAEALVWFAYYVPVRLKAAWMRLFAPGPRVWFTPDRPRPWYLVWAAAAWAGVRVARSPGEAQAAFYFDDSATGAPPLAGLGNGGPARRINWRCTDVTKSHVARMFEQAFGYPLAVDPGTAVGPLVEKGEDNGVHDGRIVQAPCPALPGKTYQKLIDNTEGDLVADLRTPCVGGRPVIVFIKRRPVADRFANHNSHVDMTTPQAVFSPEEIARIGDFCAAMGLDWGGLDILRDSDGRLYVVDVNKTDMGPPIALPLREKLAATGLLAAAFLHLIQHEAEMVTS